VGQPGESFARSAGHRVASVYGLVGLTERPETEVWDGGTRLLGEGGRRFSVL